MRRLLVGLGYEDLLLDGELVEAVRAWCGPVEPPGFQPGSVGEASVEDEDTSILEGVLVAHLEVVDLEDLEVVSPVYVLA